MESHALDIGQGSGLVVLGLIGLLLCNPGFDFVVYHGERH